MVAHSWPELLVLECIFHTVYIKYLLCVRACVCVQKKGDLQQYEVEDFIAQLMDQEFNTVVDDESLPQVQ